MTGHWHVHPQDPGCTPVDAWRLFRRILICFLTGNTDAHLKNFAMFHAPDGLRLMPAYDLVAAALESYGLAPPVLTEAVDALDRRRKATERAVTAAAKRIGEQVLGITTS